MKNPNTIKKENQRYQRLFDKYFKIRYILIGVILIFLFSLYTDFFKVLILVAMFLPLAAYSMIASKFVPHQAASCCSGIFTGRWLR